MENEAYKWLSQWVKDGGKSFGYESDGCGSYYVTLGYQRSSCIDFNDLKMDISQLLEDAEAGRKLRDGAATDVWATIDEGFSAYQGQAQRTARTEMLFRDRLAVAALGLVGEAAEVSEKVKKHLGHGHDLDTLAMLEELGDVLWYIAEMTSLLGAEMGVVAGMNAAKLRARYPDGFSEEASRER